MFFDPFRPLSQASLEIAPHIREKRQIALAFVLTLGRGPDKVELEAAREFFQKQAPEGKAKNRESALVRFCHALLNVNEFV